MRPAAARICKQLAADGVGMLRFDALGLGGSEGDWGDGSFTCKVNDIIRACRFMADRGTPAELLVGHSWGGSAAIAAARDCPGVRAVVTVGAPFDPTHVEHQYDACLDQVFAEGSGQWMVGGKTLTLDARMLPITTIGDYSDLDQLAGPARLKSPAVRNGVTWSGAVGPNASLRQDVEGTGQRFLGGDFQLGWLGDWVMAGASAHRSLMFGLD